MKKSQHWLRCYQWGTHSSRLHQERVNGPWRRYVWSKDMILGYTFVSERSCYLNNARYISQRSNRYYIY